MLRALEVALEPSQPVTQSSLIEHPLHARRCPGHQHTKAEQQDTCLEKFPLAAESCKHINPVGGDKTCRGSNSAVGARRRGD